MNDQLLPGRFIGEQPIIQQEQQQIPQQQMQPNPFNQMFQEERVRNFLSQTSPVSTLERIDYILRGYVFEESTKEWLKVSDGIPSKIRLDFLQFITSDLSEDVRMTNLEAKQINGVMESTIEWLVDYFDIISDEEEIKDDAGNIYVMQEEQMTKYCWMMIKVVFFTLLRAQNGIENSRIFKSLSLGGNVDPLPSHPQQEKKWFQFWK